MEFFKPQKHFFFIGIAGAGMSAIAQYLVGAGMKVSGSDRQFSTPTPIREHLEVLGIKCFAQNCSGISLDIDIVVVSTAIETTVPEYKKALDLGLQIIMRSDLLAKICLTRKTIAVSGTSGKSTVSAMIFQIMNFAGLSPSLITGAGLVSLKKEGKIGNAVFGKGEHLIIEADESDGSLVKYKPYIGLILNIDKDHKEISELNEIFSTFAQNTQHQLIVNQDCEKARVFSENIKLDFGTNTSFEGKKFSQTGFSIRFEVENQEFNLNMPGKHNMQNVTAALAASNVSLKIASKALLSYQGIDRRHQIIGTKKGITLVDDYAHNPTKLAASMRACQLPNSRLITWFQLHGFKPTRFLRAEFVHQINKTLRPNDEIWFSEIYYAGGSATKDISAEDLINDLRLTSKNAFFVKKRDQFPEKIKNKLKNGDVILITGARDSKLSTFAKFVFHEI